MFETGQETRFKVLEISSKKQSLTGSNGLFCFTNNVS